MANKFDKILNRYREQDSGGGGGGSVNSVNSGTAISVDNTDAANPIVNLNATTANVPDSTDARYITDAEEAILDNTSGVNTGDQTSVSGNAGTATKLATARNIDGQSFDGSADITVIAPGTHAATSKTTPVDADEIPLVDSAASNVLKKLTWTNLKATAKTYFDTIYQASLGYTAENVANKDTTTSLGTSDTKYPSQKAVKTYVDAETTRAETAEALLAPLASPTFTGTVTVPTTINPTDPAQKSYVDALAQGLNVKPSAIVATTTVLPTYTYLSNVITMTSTGTVTIDGHVLALNDIVLVKDETLTNRPYNGLYTVTTAGAVGVACVLTRNSRMNTGAEFPGSFIFIESGTANASAGYVCTNVTAPTLGTDNIAFQQFSGAGEITNGTGLSKSGNTLSIDSTVATLTGSQALTNKDMSGAGNTFPTFNQNTSGSAADLSATLSPAHGGTGVANSKNLTVSNSLTVAGTDSTTMTFPSTSATIARTDAAQTFTGTQSATSFNETSVAVTVSSNAGTCAVANGLNTFTNSSAATMAITIATSGAVDGQLMIVRIYDFSAAAQTIGWTNTENSTVSAPTTSNGSTTLPLTVGWQFNSQTTKWRCIATA